MNPVQFQPRTHFRSLSPATIGRPGPAPMKALEPPKTSSPTDSVSFSAPKTPSVSARTESQPAAPPVETKSPEPPRQNAAPTTLVQLDETTPLSASNEPLSETQLVTKAMESYGKAESHFDQATEAMASLPPNELQSAKESVTFSVASLMGEYKTQGADGQSRPMMAEEIRKEYSGLPKEQQDAFKARVRDFAGNNPQAAQIGMASGAAQWGQDRWTTLDADEKAGKAVDQDLKLKAGLMCINGNGYNTETGHFADAVNGLVQGGRAELAQSVVDATVNA